MACKNILIIGSSGMIGGAFNKLLRKKENTRVFAPTSKQLNLFDREKLLTFMNENGINWVFLAAGKVGGIQENILKPATFLTENSMMALNCMWAAHKAGVEKVIVFGSSCMYPINSPQPISEDSLFSGQIEQTSFAYGVSKILTAQAARAYNTQYKNGTKFICVVPNSTFGPGDNFNPSTGHVLSSLMSKIHYAHVENSKLVRLWGTGEPKREFVYCDDVADACWYLLSNDIEFDDHPINISSPSEIRIIDLANLIAEVVGFEGEFVFDTTKPDGAMRKSLNTNKICSLGWRPRYSLVEGIKETYNWFSSKHT